MKCEEFGRFLDNYENLTDNEKAEMTDHAAMCEKCKQELDFFLSMLSVTKSLPKIDPPADFMDTLNKRLDAEDKNPSPNKIIYHVRRNWKQYTSLAACLALVAVITANRGILLDRIEGNEDGVITEETVSDGDNTAPDVPTAPAETDAPVAPAAAPEQAQPKESAAGSSEVSTADNSGAVSSGTVREASTGRVVSRPSAQVSRTTQASSAAVETSTGSGAAAEMNENSAKDTVRAETGSNTIEERTSGDYGIALRSAVTTDSETASADYDLKPDEVSASLRASRIIDSYSLAEGSESIALGAYYALDKNGKPIMTIDDNAIKAVGSLKISSDDAEKAMQILNQYPHDENENVYTTGSENVEEILSELSDEDVTYTNYIVGGSDDVKFRIEFN